MSYGVLVQVFNLTRYPVTLRVALDASSNWEKAPNLTPMALNGARLASNTGSVTVHCEVANGQAVALFTIQFVNDNGDVIATTVADANGSARGHIRKGPLPCYETSGTSTPYYQVLEAQYPAKASSDWPNHAIALLPAIDARTWMSQLKDETRLFELTIPGTHDTGANLNIIEGSRCQDLSIGDQLDAGIRFLDVRLDTAYPLQIIHGGSHTEKYYRDDCCAPIAEFLKYRGVNETVLLCVGQDSAGNFHRSVQQILENTLDGYFGPGEGRKRMVTDLVPGPLGTLRGKVVMLRRYDIDKASIDAGFNQPFVQLKAFESHDGKTKYSWPDNSDTFADTGDKPGDSRVFWQTGSNNQAAFAIQDYYSLLEVKWPDKVALIEKYMDVSSTAYAGTWFINFLSATYDIVTATPRAFAEGYNGINAWIFTYMLTHGMHRYGTLPTDFVPKPEGLIDLMINSNQPHQK